MKLRLFLILVPVLVLILALTFVIFKINEDRLRSSVKTQELERVDAFVEDVSREYQYVKSMLAYISRLKPVGQTLKDTRPIESSRLVDDFKTRFSMLLEHQADFTGLALIDNSGKTIIGLEKFGKKIIATDEENTNDYSESQAFQNAIKVQDDQIYAAMMQLETSNGYLTSPTKPIVDFFKIVVGQTGERLGMLRLTYDATAILKKLDKIEARSGGQILLSNAQGYFLKAKKQAHEWGFQFEDRKDKTLQTIYGRLWKQIQNQVSRQFQFNNKLYTLVNICDQSECANVNITPAIRLDIISGGMPWTFISELDLSQDLAASKTSERWYLVYAMIGILGAIALLSGIAGWRLIMANVSLEHAKKEATGKDKLFSTFINGNPSLIYAKDKKGKYVIVNKAYAEFLNEPAESLIGKSDFDLEGVDVDQISQQLMREQFVLYSGELSISDETWLSQKNEKTNFVVTRFPVVLDGDNEFDMIGVIAIDVTERDMARSEISQKEALFRTLVNSSPNAFMIVNDEGSITFANKKTNHIFGWEHDELIGEQIEKIIPEEFRSHQTNIHKQSTENHNNGSPTFEYQTKALTKHAEQLDVEITLSPIKINNSLMTMVIVRDVTDKLKMESHIRQSQKMEAIGHLTGGVAHDFNNLLGVIIGNLDLLSTMFPDDNKAQKRINGALKASLSGAELTKRLLAFARKQTLNPQVNDIASAIEEMIPLLDRTLKGEVELKVDASENLGKVFIDIGEFENVILNLAINARDAMPKGGILTIEAEEIHIDEDFVKVHDESLAPGRYIHISISDTGSGMPDEVMKHIFEPFYTTKEKGKGTGLGLAMAHGFVTQSKGLIQVYSEQDAGTTFHIYLPVVDEDRNEKNNSQAMDAKELRGGNETILVIDDEADLAEIAAAYLEGLGYQTLVAYSGEAAMDLLAEHSEIQLVLTDIIMPGGMDGVDLHQRLQHSYPDVKVVYASGFSADALTNKRGHKITADLIQKPYRKQNLGIVIKKNLDSNPNE